MFPRTNDRLYESNDSREIEKGSISVRLGEVFVDAFECLGRWGQKFLLSGGDG